MLPIQDVLPSILAHLDAGSTCVVVAPPGAGKTTAIAPALLDRDWCTGEVLLLSPRRLAARAAAERIAEQMGQAAGRLVGYATRLDSRRSAATRLTVMTEGIFLARIQADPELADVSAVLFDEVHERSLDSDFGLALALDAQAGLRPDLRLVAMSATLDGARFSALMDGAPVVESEGRSHPLDLRHIGRSGADRIEDAVAAAVRRALGDADGGVLAFLPGVAEIERTADRLATLPAGVVVHRLHGQVDPAAQRAAIGRARDGERKVVLATSIAETSLTLDGIRIVVDSGLSRRPRYDRAAGITRLVTERASRAAVTQRAGRAARQAPGVAYRLWEAAATDGLPPFDPPEIVDADLSALLLDCAIWGVADPRALRWLDPPSPAALAEARERLDHLDALDPDGRPTAHGRRLARLPLPPRLGHMLVRAGERGWARVAARVAVLLGERGLGGNDVDLERRLRRWRQERGPRAASAARLAARWAALVGGGGEGGDDMAAACIALAFPDRLARRRDAAGERWASVGGRGFRLDPDSGLATAEWLAIADVSGSAAGARILSAAAIDDAAVTALFGDRIEQHRVVRFDPETRGVRATRERRLGAIRLSEGPDVDADPAAMAQALLAGVRAGGVQLLPWPDAAAALRARAAFAGTAADAIGMDALAADLDEWLPPLLAGRRRLGDVDPGALMAVLDARLGWTARAELDRVAPAAFRSPAGSTHPIDYAAEGGPRVELRVQALFGLADHPVVGAGRVPLVLSLTSPAGRPIQTTRDLPGFWAGSWREVAREMRGRYPRHPWPDDPAAATATLRTKRADARG
ncbi:ATP-dependent helicase HrpB [Sphingomonas jejuensis]|uniref:ATP-dependent helicase HrpB n=1 Tax=Sphingomonas jejuensis TaxID=904715 RepID=A0ABX0XND8_9SPHN|nr:ATP-dependent helicase HrpB [Sphingomonas jejuensis]NJC34299.1 ATP-dependent helicase HrpB [Sphingomonas jejuensis]